MAFFFQPPAAADPDQAASASELPVSASAVNVPQAPSQASALEPAGALEARAEPERPAVPREQQSKRERHRGERPGPRGQGQQTCSSLQELSDEAHHPLHGSRGPRGCSHRPERRPGGRHSQEFPKPRGRSRATALAERKELDSEGPLPVTDTVDLKGEQHDVEKWTQEGAEATGREKENLTFNRSDHRSAPSWQGHHRPWDCGRWERPSVQGRGSYPRAPRGRGMFRPGGRREPHLEESGS